MKALSRNEIIVRNRKIGLAVVIITAFLSAFIFFSTRADAENSKQLHTYYTSYEIQPGDTLWTIADKYMTADSPDKATFINTIKRLNHISTDNITAGRHLIIQYAAY